jgi:hypothetical protein
MKQEIAKLICFGQGGDTVHLENNSTICGYGSPEQPHASKPSESLTIPDGCPVIDKREAVETEKGYKHVFNGPMVNVDLADEEIDPCPFTLDVFGINGLTKVSTKKYIEGWKSVGARIGYYKNQQIVWEDENAKTESFEKEDFQTEVLQEKTKEF